MIPYLLAAAFCVALGYLLRMLSEEDRPPRESNVVDLPVGMRRHPRLVAIGGGVGG